MSKTSPLNKRVRASLIITIPLLIIILVFGAQIFTYYIVRINFLRLTDDADIYVFNKVLHVLSQHMWLYTLAAGIFGIFLAYGITLPIKRLTESTRQIATGNLTRTVQIGSEDEIGALGKSFNTMVSSLNEHIIESMTGGVITINMKGIIATFNKSAELILGYNSDDVVGKSVFEFLPENTENKMLRQVIEDTLTKYNTSSSREINILSKSGKKVPIGITTSLLKDKNNTLLGIVVTFKDLGQIKHLEEQMRRADRLAAVGSLAAGIAHEIRNPLGSVKGLVQLLQEDLKEDDKKRAYAEIITKEVDRLNKVVEELLSFARPENAELEAKFVPVNINEVIEDTLQLAGHDAKTTNIQISKNFSADMPLVAADAKKLQQAFLNLIFNAFDAMKNGGIFTVSTRYRKEDDSAQIQFADTGSGIPLESLSKIFDPFYTTKKGGTGLGLTITHQIISGHGGKIDVKSKPAEGTNFTVILPVRLKENKSNA